MKVSCHLQIKHQSIIGKYKVWTEEEYEDYLKGIYGLDFIAGYTEGGIPLGLPADETVETENNEKKIEACFDDDIPF